MAGGKRLALDVGARVVAAYAALLVRFSWHLSGSGRWLPHYLVPIGALVLSALRVEEHGWDGLDGMDVARIAAAVALGSAAFLIAIRAVGLEFSRAFLVLQALLGVLAITGVRIAWTSAPWGR